MSPVGQSEFLVLGRVERSSDSIIGRRRHGFEERMNLLVAVVVLFEACLRAKVGRWQAELEAFGTGQLGRRRVATRGRRTGCHGGGRLFLSCRVPVREADKEQARSETKCSNGGCVTADRHGQERGTNEDRVVLLFVAAKLKFQNQCD